MTHRREGVQNPFWNRIEAVMSVVRGEKSVAKAAQDLGVSREYYYQLEAEMLKAALVAVTPSKRGPKVPATDSALQKLESRLQEVSRERELLQIKVKHLEQLQREMVTRGIGVLREKKRRRRTAQGGRHGAPVHGGIQATGAVEAGRTAEGRRNDPGTLPGNGTRASHSISVEGQGSGRPEARPEGPGR